MAVVKLKVDDNSCPKSLKQQEQGNKSESVSFRIYDACLIVLSMGTFLLDLVTDAILVVSYLESGYFFWAMCTLLLIIVPAVIIQVFSMRWHIMDEATDMLHWIAHIFLLGLLHRYIVALKTGLEVRSAGDLLNFQRLQHQQNDICMLRLFESLMESAPQLVLQLYIMITLEDWHSWTGISAVASLASLAWALAAYTKAMREARPDKHSLSGIGFLLQALWRGSMITARITALVLFAVAFKVWLFLLLGVHWIGMTIWIMFQKTDFCQSPWEEKIYNCVVGVIYCFCFFNLKEGRSRKRALAFYTITVLQNMGCLGMFIGFSGLLKPNLVIFGIAAVIGGTILGISSMLLYYGFFHPAGRIKLHSKVVNSDVKCRREVQGSILNQDDTATIRSLKHCWDSYRMQPEERNHEMPSNDGSPHSDVTTDKKLLLTSWVPCQAATPFECLNLGIDIADDINTTKQTVEDVLTPSFANNDDAVKQKRRGIYSPEEINIDIENSLEKVKELSYNTDTEVTQNKTDTLAIVHEINTNGEALSSEGSEANQVSNLSKRKCRHICSPLDFGISFGEVCSNVDNIKERMLGPLVNDASDEQNCAESCVASFPCNEQNKIPEVDSCDIKPSEIHVVGSDDSPSEILSVPSEVLSAHDYENICAVNIAREAWGLRSWRGYSDIETWLHDDSVVRDRRRDTLTSTVTTITSASSDNSTASGEHLSRVSPPPVPCRRPNPSLRIHRSRQDDYLDTLIDDLAECENAQNAIGYIAEQDSECNIFIARPYVVDQHGGLHPLTTLDTIEEELEESSTENGESIRLRQRHDSASTLVATIDEIRRGSSLCNLYNSAWDSRSCSSVSSFSNSSQKSSVKNSFPITSVYSTSLPSLSSPLRSTHSYESLTPEEVLFLSKLKPRIERDTRKSHTVSEFHKCPELILDAKSYLISHSPEINPVCSPQIFSSEMNQKVNKPNRIRRKFSLLREKFERREFSNDSNLELDSFNPECLPVVSSNQCVVDRNIKTFFKCDQKSEIISNKDSVIPAVTSRIKQWNSILKNQNSDLKEHLDSSNISSAVEGDSSRFVKPNFINLKERRSVFLKQVLSPPKFQSKSKKVAISPFSKRVYAS